MNRSPTESQAPAFAPCHPGWYRIRGADAVVLKQLEQELGLETSRLSSHGLFHHGEYSYCCLEVLQRGVESLLAQHVILAVSESALVSLEPPEGCPAFEEALRRLRRDGHDNHPFHIFAVLLQSLSDSADALLDTLGENLWESLIQTNAVLNSLEGEKKDYGVSDVVATQIRLNSTEEILTRLMEGQMTLNRCVRHVLPRVARRQPDLLPLYQTLIADTESVEEMAEFVHLRIRVLQQTNNMALSVKQNQIIKVFSIITCVFLPPLLISTYYSMNIAYMPILEWQFGEPMVMFLTLALALVPLLYVKHRGWLR